MKASNWTKVNQEDYNVYTKHIFAKIADYSNIQVFKLNEDNYLVNQDWEILGPFDSIENDQNGFIKTDYNGEIRYIDMLGRISNEPTQSGIAFFMYYNEYAKLKHLKNEFFEDDVFYNAVLDIERRRAIKTIKSHYADAENLSSLELKKAINTINLIKAKRNQNKKDVYHCVKLDKDISVELNSRYTRKQEVRINQEKTIKEVFENEYIQKG